MVVGMGRGQGGRQAWQATQARQWAGRHRDRHRRRKATPMGNCPHGQAQVGR